MSLISGKPTEEEQKEIKMKIPFADIAPEVWSSLSNLPRTGWLNRKIPNPETVKEHTESLINLASTFEGLTDEERKDLSEMLAVHDWPESVHGDEVILGEESDQKAKLMQTKFEKEKSIMEKNCKVLGNVCNVIMSLWMRFETSNDAIATLARQLDKYQAVEKASYYEKTTGIKVFKDFFNYSQKFISHPLLLDKIEALESDWLSLQNKL